MDTRKGPLSGFRVLELGNLIAAPYAGRLFAEFGADVIKVERPRTGDELRRWRLFRGSTSLFWFLQARNKRSITLDLRTPEGQEIVLKLLPHVDVVLENFRPGTLERWNLGYEALKAVNPDVIFVRISGYGQTGPYRDRPGFGGIAEAMGGLRHLTGYPDRPPTRLGVSLGDSLAGMFGAIGALMALLHREHQRVQGLTSASPSGQVIDVALYEAVFAVTESLLPEYDGYGIIRQRTGNILPGLTPSNIYACQEGKWVVIGGNADGVFKRLMRAIGRADLAEDPRFADNPGRTRHQEFLDGVIADWTSRHTLDEVPAVLESWYGGQEQGNALADVLFGDINPSGKLPVTFPRSDHDTPVSSPEQYAGRDGFVASFREGLGVGYRGYDQLGLEPLFPFGYGLSYTSFAYAQLQVEPQTSDGTRAVQVRFTVTNTGAWAGAEIAQVYLGLPASTSEPPRRLVGWAKVEVDPGETKKISVTLDPNSASRPLSYWNVNRNGWEIASGDYTVYVGASSRDIRLTSTLRVHHTEKE